jgi:hypothetical protein
MIAYVFLLISLPLWSPHAASRWPYPGCRDAKRPGTFISPQSKYQARTRASRTGVSCFGVTIMSMSKTGFAGSPMMDVLPTCSIAWYGTFSRIVSKEALAFWNSTIHTGLCCSIVTLILKFLSLMWIVPMRTCLK